jgi:hypothetical protein
MPRIERVHNAIAATGRLGGSGYKRIASYLLCKQPVAEIADEVIRITRSSPNGGLHDVT